MSKIPQVNLNMNPVVFVTGCHRSGTSALAKLLSYSPSVNWLGWEMNYEFENFIHLDEAGSSVGRVERSVRFGEMLAKYRALSIINDGGSASDVARNDFLYLIKSPNLLDKVEELSRVAGRLIPVVVIREVYSYVASMKKHLEKMGRQRKSGMRWSEEKDTWEIVKDISLHAKCERSFPGGNVYYIAKSWLKRNYNAVSRLGDSAIYVSFESLMSDHASVFEDVCAKVGLGRESIGMPGDLLEADTVYNYVGSSDPLKSWETELSAEEKRQVEKACRDMALMFSAVEEKRASGV
ncbi:sulfotransferase [Halomonas sp. THAF12]|uniref:sulfotransferase n=1 Tax=Halomonas sp. B23F22_10 TaxID=3459515 RepID=UPI00373FB3BC